LDVLKELRYSGRYDAKLKIVVLSNLNKTDYERQAKENGADGFIGKTEYTPSELADEVKKVLAEFAAAEKKSV